MVYNPCLMEELGMKKDAPDQETEKGCLLNL